MAHELGLPVTEISIIGADGVGGWVDTGWGHMPLMRGRVERIDTMMHGGRAADSLLGDGASAGAVADINAVNSLLRSAMLEYGLYGSLSTASNIDPRDWSDGVSLWSAIHTELPACLPVSSIKNAGWGPNPARRPSKSPG